MSTNFLRHLVFGVLYFLFLPLCWTQSRYQDSLILVEAYDSMHMELASSPFRWNLIEPMDNWLGVELNESGRVSRCYFGSVVTGQWRGVIHCPASIVRLSDLKSFHTGERTASMYKVDIDSLFDLSLEFLSLGLYPERATAYLPKLANSLGIFVAFASMDSLPVPFPWTLIECTNLEEISLQNNFVGVIDTSIVNLHKLKSLAIGSTKAHGGIPQNIGGLKRLEDLSIRGNAQITGRIPTSIGELKSLRALHLSANHLSGKIPLELYDLDSLETLFLDSNRFGDTLSASIANMKSLVALNLIHNQFYGNLPEEMAELDKLEDIKISLNNFFGEIPESWGHFESLRSMRMFDNRLEGGIPASLINNRILLYLLISENELSEPLPYPSDSSKLLSLEIQRNRFTFEDLIHAVPFLKANLRSFRYAPQKKAGGER